jgi:hypothetical protein
MWGAWEDRRRDRWIRPGKLTVTGLMGGVLADLSEGGMEAIGPLAHRAED